MIEYIKKDITTVTSGVLAHGVNCRGVMGAGVAKIIRNRWPVVYDVYKHTCSLHVAFAQELLGTCETVYVPASNDHLFGSLYIANLYTQLNYGRDGNVYANVDAINSAMEKCISFCHGLRTPLYMPRIGCGLGGLNWEKDVLPIVERHASEYGVPVYVCDL